MKDWFECSDCWEWISNLFLSFMAWLGVATVVLGVVVYLAFHFYTIDIKPIPTKTETEQAK